MGKLKLKKKEKTANVIELNSPWCIAISVNLIGFTLIAVNVALAAGYVPNMGYVSPPQRFGYGHVGYVPYYMVLYGPSYGGSVPNVAAQQWSNIDNKPYKEGYGIGYDTHKHTYLFTY